MFTSCFTGPALCSSSQLNSSILSLSHLLCFQVELSFSKMAWTRSFIFHNRLCSLSIFFVFLLILSTAEMIFIAEGRAHLKSSAFSPKGEEEKAVLRARIGSVPPKCDRRCSKCGHCEAIQVPTNPQVQNGKKNSSTIFGVAYARGDDNTNYKPMSWKCKCGKFIFDP